jgi:hypothetical protein
VNGTPCQDASACELVSQTGTPAFVGVVCDGAGSAPLAQYGARYACQILLSEARDALRSGAGVAALDRSFALEALARVQHALARLARRLQRTPRDFACTLLFAAADERAAAFAQIGDGAIVVAPGGAGRGGGFDWVFWPQQGEYVNETHFACETHAERHLCCELRDQSVEELALFSDGLQGLVLDSRRRVAHTRFFEPMFVAMRWARPGLSDGLSRSLERFLCSRVVEARTDDDKSLILASRRSPEPPPALPVLAGASLSTAFMPRELRE